jgi:hypothetical protein
MRAGGFCLVEAVARSQTWLRNGVGPGSFTRGQKRRAEIELKRVWVSLPGLASK